MGHEEVRCLSRGQEFREGGEVNHLRETVDHGQDGGVALGRGKTRNKVQGDVGPWSTGDGEWPEQSRRGSMGRLAPGAHLTSRHELPDIVLQGGPPEAPPNELAGPGGYGMTGELAGVTPHENPAPDGLWDEEAIPGSSSWGRLGALGRPDSQLETPGDNPHYPGGRYDGRWVSDLRGMLTLENTGHPPECS